MSNAKAIVASIDPKVQTEWIVSFNTIDTSGDGFLQRSELAECLKHIGSSATSKELDAMMESVGFKQEFDENGEETNGMDLDQFILMMALQDKAAKEGGDTAVGIAGAFNNARMADLAKRNSFKHKKVEADDGMMERLSKQVRCKNCRSNYVEEENGDQSCCYHPGPMKSEGGRVRNDLDKTLFVCCGTEQIGTAPVLFAPPGCKKGKHEPDVVG